MKKFFACTWLYAMIMLGMSCTLNVQLWSVQHAKAYGYITGIGAGAIAVALIDDQQRHDLRGVGLGFRLIGTDGPLVSGEERVMGVLLCIDHVVFHEARGAGVAAFRAELEI